MRRWDVVHMGNAAYTLATKIYQCCVLVGHWLSSCLLHGRQSSSAVYVGRYSVCLTLRRANIKLSPCLTKYHAKNACEYGFATAVFMIVTLYVWIGSDT